MFAGVFGLLLPGLAYKLFIKNNLQVSAIEVAAFRIIAMLEISLALLFLVIKNETNVQQHGKFKRATVILLVLHALVHGYHYFVLHLYLPESIISGVVVNFLFALALKLVK